MESKLTRIAAIAAGLGLTATLANAQKGTFNLPVRAHWGNVVLDPGEHSVRTPIPIGQTLVYLTSDEGTKVTVPIIVERTNGSDRSYLRLARIGGEYYVEEFRSGPDGITYVFPKPKNAREINSGAEESDAGTISVAAK